MASERMLPSASKVASSTALKMYLMFLVIWLLFCHSLRSISSYIEHSAYLLKTVAR